MSLILYEEKMDNENQTIGPLLLTPKEAAKALSICERTLYSLSKSGEIPTVRIGRSVRYDITDLRSWIKKTKNYSESA